MKTLNEVVDSLIEEGTKVEEEHSETYRWMIDECKKGHPPKAHEFFERIALDHLNEDPDYYFKLKKYVENNKGEPEKEISHERHVAASMQEQVLQENATLAQIGRIMSNPTQAENLLKGRLGASGVTDAPARANPLELYRLLRDRRLISPELSRRIATVLATSRDDVEGMKKFMRVGGAPGLILAYYGYNQITEGDWKKAVEALQADLGAKWEDLLAAAQAQAAKRR